MGMGRGALVCYFIKPAKPLKKLGNLIIFRHKIHNNQQRARERERERERERDTVRQTDRQTDWETEPMR